MISIWVDLPEINVTLLFILKKLKRKINIGEIKMVESNNGKKPRKIRESKPSKLEDQEVVDLFQEKNPWGMNVSIDLYECDPKLIKDKKYVKKLSQN